MQNLKSRIRRRKQALGRGTTSSASTSVGVDWEFVNFNPVVYGPKKLATDATHLSPNSSQESENVSLLRASRSHSEDYYEFPTSAKLRNISSLSPTTSTSSST